MKKQLFLLSALALTALTSCGNNSGGKLKVGLICLHGESSTYDKNFMEAFKAACEEAKTKGIVEDYRIVDDIGEDESCSAAAEQLINDGYRAIFTDSFGHDAYIHQIAADYPDVFFSSATGIEARNSGLKNYHNAFASIYEGRYLAGVAAGEYLKQVGGKKPEDKFNIGYVGAKSYAEVISGYTAWYLGVKSVLKNVTMSVTYTNEWYDETGEKTAAETLIDGYNCELISQHADSYGAPTACEQEEVPNVSYNMDTSARCPKTYIAHSRINWKPYYEKAIEAAAKGADTPVEGEKEQNWTGSLKDDSVEYNVSKLVPNKTPIEDAENAIKNGTLHIFDTKNFKVDKNRPENQGKEIEVASDGTLTSYKADTTDDYKPDTELVNENGYIDESVYRSAPSFDLIIEGITIIGQ